MNIHGPLVIALLSSLGWTVLFSMSSTTGVRGYRNLGILSAYICLVVFLFRASRRDVMLTWLLFAVMGGLSYTAWEVLQRVRTPQGVEKPKVSFAHVFPALAIWPILIPEAVEYALAEMGVLKAKKANKAPEPTP